MLQRMAAMRAAKARKRLSGPPPEPEPRRMIRWTGLSLGVRDDTTGEVAWVPFRSVRDAARRLAVVLRNYQIGPSHPRPSASICGFHSHP